jgi:hypothetical protein
MRMWVGKEVARSGENKRIDVQQKEGTEAVLQDKKSFVLTCNSNLNGLRVLFTYHQRFTLKHSPCTQSVCFV